MENRFFALFLLGGLAFFLCLLFLFFAQLAQKRLAEPGGLHEHVATAAKLAGVRPSHVYVVTRSPVSSMGALQSAANQLFVSESALLGWSARELTAAAAMAFLTPGLTVAGTLGALAVWSGLLWAHDAQRVAAFLCGVGLIFWQARQRRRAATNAAMRAADALKDPEGTIAALARLAPLRSWPWHWTPQGVKPIPSFAQLVAQVATAHGIPAEMRDALVARGLEDGTPFPVPGTRYPGSPGKIIFYAWISTVLVPPAIMVLGQPSGLTLGETVPWFVVAVFATALAATVAPSAVAWENERRRIPTATHGGWVVGAAPGATLRVFGGASYVAEYVELWMDGRELRLQGHRFAAVLPASQLVQIAWVPGFLLRGPAILLRYRQPGGEHGHLLLWASTWPNGATPLRQMMDEMVAWRGAETPGTPIPAIPIQELSDQDSVEATSMLTSTRILVDGVIMAAVAWGVSAAVLGSPAGVLCATSAAATAHVLRLYAFRLSYALSIPPAALPGSPAAATSGSAGPPGE